MVDTYLPLRPEHHALPARANYATNFGTDWECFDRTDGVSHFLSSIRIADVVDGASVTAAFSESTIAAAVRQPGSRGPGPAHEYVANQSDLEAWCVLPSPPGGSPGSYRPGLVRRRGQLPSRPGAEPTRLRGARPIRWIYGVSSGAYERSATRRAASLGGVHVCCSATARPGSSRRPSTAPPGEPWEPAPEARWSPPTIEGGAPRGSPLRPDQRPPSRHPRPLGVRRPLVDGSPAVRRPACLPSPWPRHREQLRLRHDFGPRRTAAAASRPTRSPKKQPPPGRGDLAS